MFLLLRMLLIDKALRTYSKQELDEKKIGKFIEIMDPSPQLQPSSAEMEEILRIVSYFFINFDQFFVQKSDVNWELFIQEEQRLNTLKESLQKSAQLKTNMIGILDSFEKRLENLEYTVLPLYEQTAKLQKKQKSWHSNSIVFVD